jgi:hypothetical protein
MANIFRPSTWLRSSKDARNSEGVDASATASDLDRNESVLSSTAERPSREAARVHVEQRRPPIEEVERRAYVLWVEAGCPQGRDVELWLAAETELLEKIQSRR